MSEGGDRRGAAGQAVLRDEVELLIFRMEFSWA